MLKDRVDAVLDVYFRQCAILVTALGIWLLSQMTAETSRFDLAWRMLVLGIGLGPGQSLFSLAVQNAMPSG